MTTSDQTFVKAYARRQQALRGEASAASQPGDDSPRPAAQDELLQIDDSVAQSTMLWIDQAEGERMRADQPQSPVVPSPQLVSLHPERAAETERSESHTAYAMAAFVEHPIEPALDELSDRPSGESTDTIQPESGRAATVPGTEHDVCEIRIDTAHDDPSAADVASPSNAGHAPDSPEPASADAGDTTAPLPAPSQLPAKDLNHATVPAFRAAWEVDSFDAPPAVNSLFRANEVGQLLADQMSAAIDGGLKSILVTSVNAGEGRSTVAIGLALAVGAAGYRVALVDGDIHLPSLADELRLDLEYGWLDAMRGGLSVAEVSVLAIHDSVTLIPLMPPAGATAATADEIETVIARVKPLFDLIIIDGPLGSAALIDKSTAIDTALIVRDEKATNTITTNALARQLRGRGVRGIGVVDNFTRG